MRIGQEEVVLGRQGRQCWGVVGIFPICATAETGPLACKKWYVTMRTLMDDIGASSAPLQLWAFDRSNNPKRCALVLAVPPKIGLIVQMSVMRVLR
jgi:hypothetical protein